MGYHGAKEKRRRGSFFKGKLLMRIIRTNLIIMIIFLAGVLLPKLSFSQMEADHWMLGPGRYVYFNHGTYPDTISYPNQTSQIFFGSGCTSYSDKNGNLLFYGGGGSIYDRNFQMFPSVVAGLSTEPLNYAYGEATQSILTVPYPGHDSLYIVFHIWRNLWNNYRMQLCYSVINMNLRNGLGEIEPSQRNILLLNGVDVGYKLTSVLHCNKKDIWIIGHLANSDQYYSLLVTGNGITTTPVYFPGAYISSGTGPGFSTNPNHFGCVKVSASGNRLAAAYKGLGIVELMDFNTQTGTGSGLKTLDAVPPDTDTVFVPGHEVWYGPWGLDFSPSGDRLYVTGNYSFRQFTNYNWGAYLYQFDASLPSGLQIQNSRFRIDSIEWQLAGAIQVANNGKMYVNVENNLNEIADPENLGMACNYSRLKVRSGIQFADRNIPTYLQSYFRYPVIATGNCQFQNINFTVQNISGVSNIIWDFGDPASGINNVSASFNPGHIFSQEGSYEVKAVLYNANGCGADTIRKVVHAGPFKVFLGNDTTVCAGDTLGLRMTIPGGNNLWGNNSRDTVLRVTTPGTYWVRVNIGDCFTSDTITVSFKSWPAFSLGNDTIICSNQVLQLSPNTNLQGISYLWSNGANSPAITVNNAGDYWLSIRDNTYGCQYADSIGVQFKSLPNYSLGNDLSICEGNTVSLNAAVTGATNYLWSTGNTSSDIGVTQSGIYWADVTKDQCTYRDSISVVFKLLPVVNFGKDTTLCEGQALLLDAGNPGSQYQWQNNSTSQSFNVTLPGQYYVSVTKEGCPWADTIKIQYDLKPVFTLGADFGICEGQTTLLQPTVQSSSTINFLWQNGSTTSSFQVTQTGIYTLDISNHCGSKRDEVTVSKGVCKLYVPTAFSPNGDGLNDVFRAEYGENVTAFALEIFNRWGQRIFNSKTISSGWNGKLNGVIQPGGAYAWLIKYKTLDGPNEVLLKGTMMLIR